MNHKIHPNTFLGITIQQEWQDIGIWEMFFDQHPVKTVIELGTGAGGMSLYFAIQCKRLGITFHTFDNQIFFGFKEDDFLPKCVDFMQSFHNVDLLRDNGSIVKEVIKNAEHPIVMFFDNGDKVKEWNLFAGLLDPGDYCAVHDWGVEFFEKDISGVLVDQILRKACNARYRGFTTMWFRRYSD